MSLKKLLLPALLAYCSLTSAEVLETVDYIHYTVQHQTGNSLLKAINAVSPIGEGDRKFHGHTNWDISWRYTYEKQADLRTCKIKTATVTLKASITLPKLNSQDAQALAQFNTYLPALKKHELGHLQIAQEVARRIERSLLAQAALPSCESLKLALNDRGMALANEAKVLSRQYDEQTQHGKTQGAFLPG